MKLKKESAVEYLSNSILNYFDIKQFKSITQFTLEDIDLSGDVSSPKDKIDLDHFPHIVQPLKALTIENNLRKEVVISFPEQMSKTTLQICCLLYALAYNNLQAILVYPSEDLAVETGLTKIVPLLKNVPQFRQDLERPFAIRSDRIKLSNAICYLQGAGRKIVSRTCQLVLADEAAIFETPNNINNLNEMKKRTRSFDSCLQVFVSTPRYAEDPFWREYLQGSQGSYFLRCQNCGQLTMKSSDVHNLQFETVYNEQLKQYICVRGSERLICPKCHFEHPETLREQMIKQGGYIHSFPDKIKDFPTFQAGVLASLLNVHSWSNVADIQLASGKQSDLTDWISFDNSIRGLPFQNREYNKQDESALKKHFYKPEYLKQEDIEAVIVASDTQDVCSVYCVMALTKDNNYFVLETGRLRYLWLQENERSIINSENKRNGKSPETTLLDLLDREYCGFKPLLMLVDGRGHRSDQIKRFSQMRRNIAIYLGTNLKYQKWKPSESIQKAFLVDAKSFQAQLIFMLYFQNNKEANYLFLPENLSEQDFNQITSFQPDTSKRNGNLYQNWDCADRVHDMFDTVKMAIACFDISAKIFHKDKFKHGEARILNQKQIKQQMQKQARPAIPKRPTFRR